MRINDEEKRLDYLLSYMDKLTVLSCSMEPTDSNVNYIMEKMNRVTKAIEKELEI